MGKYKFMRIRSINDNKSNGIWFLYADSLTIIEEHFKLYGMDYFREGIQSYINHSNKPGHFTNKFAYLISITSQTSDNKFLPWPLVAAKIENEMYQSRIKGYIKGIKQYLSKDMTVLIDNPSIEILETIEKDNIVYPDINKVNLSDVRYIRWNEGKHWYAKIDKLDIVDKYGNQKWNTRQEAEAAAKWYIENNMK